MKTIVIDYGLGNVFSVCRALEYCGADVELSADPKKIESADYLVLPGVGAFPNGIKNLKEKNLIPPIKKFSESERPFMGICLGMQLMLSKGEEFEDSEGLGLIEGTVQSIPTASINSESLRVPHIGWNTLQSSGVPIEKTILSSAAGKQVYFVHSFEAKPDKPENLLSWADYGGHQITAAIYKNNIYGFQFHPERSGTVGLEIIKNFLNS